MTRTRTKIDSPTESVVCRRLENGSYETEYTTVQNTKIDNRHMVDVVTAGFKAKMAAGEIINNDLWSVSAVVEIPTYEAWRTVTRRRQDGSLDWSCRFDEPRRNYSCWHSSDILARHIGASSYASERDAKFPVVSENTLTIIGNECLAKARAKANESPALSLVSLIEAKKTLASVDRLVTAGPRLLDWARRCRRSFTREGILRPLSKDLSSQWLEYRYGFSQLYYDMMSFKEAFLDRPRRHRYTDTQTLYTSSTPLIQSVDSEFHNETLSIYRSREDRISAGCLIKATMPELSIISNLGLDKPLMTAWELVPFSFIVDWFLNTSDLVSAFDGRLDQQIAGTWITRRTIFTGLYSFVESGRHYEDEAYHMTHSGAGNISDKCREVVTQVKRVANPILIPIPTLDVNLNWKKFADLTALLRQMLSCIRP